MILPGVLKLSSIIIPKVFFDKTIAIVVKEKHPVNPFTSAQTSKSDNVIMSQLFTVDFRYGQLISSIAYAEYVDV